MNVLLSIKPQFADAIFAGEKRFEFRRSIFRDKHNVKKIYVYASKPVGMVVGEFEIEEVISDCPSSLWIITGKTSGISKGYFDKYFKGKQVAHAIKVSAVQRYDTPATLMDMFNIDRPPQSFMYV